MLQKLEWELGFSKHLFSILLVTHIGALIILWSVWLGDFSVLRVLLSLVSTVVLLLNLKRIMRTHLFRSTPRAVVKLWQESDGRFGCQFKMGQSAYALIKSDSFCSTRIIILRLKVSQRIINVIIPRDCMPNAPYQKLSCCIQQL